MLTEGFGAGFNATLAIAIVVDTSTIPAGRRTPTITNLSKLKHDPDIAVVAPPVANPSGDIVVLSVIPNSGPDAQATTDLVHRLRDGDKQPIAAAGGSMYVAGNIATDIDVSAKLGNALTPLRGDHRRARVPPAHRRLPVTAHPAHRGPRLPHVGSSQPRVTVWVFQYGHLASMIGVAARAPIVSLVPVLLIGVLFGLAMDYEVFLVSRIREAFNQNGDAAASITTGLQRSGRVICAVALIMTAVVGGFIPTGDPIIKAIAYVLTTGVLIDAFVVRLTVIPAVLALLSDHAWHLPQRLDKALPYLDIEGSPESGSFGSAGPSTHQAPQHVPR